MIRRLAASLSLLAFAICLIAGIEAGNPVDTVLERALTAMAGTMVISLIIGTMAQRMIDENVQKKEQEIRSLMAVAASEAAAAATGSLPAVTPAARKTVAK